MAERTHGSIEIDAPPEAIMSEIADFASYPEWSPNIKTVEVRETGKGGRASQVYFEVAQGPLKATYTLDYSWEDRRVSWTFVEGNNIKDMEGSYTLEPAAGGATTVVFHVTVDTPIPMMGFMRRQIEKQIIDVALKGLKKRVESR